MPWFSIPNRVNRFRYQKFFNQFLGILILIFVLFLPVNYCRISRGWGLFNFSHLSFLLHQSNFLLSLLSLPSSLIIFKSRNISTFPMRKMFIINSGGHRTRGLSCMQSPLLRGHTRSDKVSNPDLMTTAGGSVRRHLLCI